MLKPMIEQIHELIEQKNNFFIGQRSLFICPENETKCLERKLASLERRGAQIVKSTVHGNILRQQKYDRTTLIDYVTHYEQLIRLKNKLYLEETIQQRRAAFYGMKLDSDVELIDKGRQREALHPQPYFESRELEVGQYNRLEAVRYAERWWDSYNPQYKSFANNCTNYISQCLRSGGAKMTGYPTRTKGWWYAQGNWSYSWSVAHSFRWYLSGARQGLRGEERESANELLPGDVICYDFDGDGQWQHSTIVVDKDGNGEPLVNAQTSNSRMRYWKYEDSTAWTPNIKYKFFHIVVS